MKTQHTKGEWIVREWVTSGQRTVEVADGGLRSKIAVICDSHLCEEHGGSIEANARLIAAAPELLDALEEQVIWWEAMLEHAQRLEDTGMAYSCRNAIHHASAAIAKAKGNT